MVKWIAKANDDVLSHCRCTGVLSATTGQFDCPWCGCGWLISCIECGRAFVYARVIETDRAYTDIAAEDARNRGLKNVTAEDVEAVAETMQAQMEAFSVGATLVYLDGKYFPIDTCAIDFEGFFAFHKLDRLPHAVALEDASYLSSFLGDRRYWLDRERPNRHEDDC